MPTLAIAALSARALSQAARTDGYSALALDVFGDVDTQAAAAAWWPLGDGQALRIQPAKLLAGLQHAANLGACGWIAGSGFEADLDLLDAGAAVLPLIGNPAPVWRAVRDPAQFFGCLQAAGLPYPPWHAGCLPYPPWQAGCPQAVSLPYPPWQATAPVDASGWLLKHPGSSGGSAVQHLAQWRSSGLPWPATAYAQRLLPGQPVSLSFIANGRRALVLGCNQQQVQALVGDGGSRPFGFAGVSGPVALPPAAAATLRRALAVLVAHFQLRGLGSLDALLDGQQVHLLELNPRPPASLQLYPGAAGHGVVAAHIQACQHGRLPAAPRAGQRGRRSPARVRGLRVVHTPAALQVTTTLSAQLASWPGVQDVPQPGTRLATGDPLCSLHCSAASAVAVQAGLHRAQAHLLRHLGITRPVAETVPSPAPAAESLPT